MGCKCFQYYYQDMVQLTLKPYFPRQISYEYVISYERFLVSLLKLLPGLYVFLKYATLHMPHCICHTAYATLQNQRTGIYFIDSKQLPVCQNRRIHSHRVFERIARRGKSSTGWLVNQIRFTGLKLHQPKMLQRFRWSLTT